MSQYAKSIVAAVAAVLIAGIQAWQVTVDGAPFRLIDGLPIIVAVIGAFLTYLVPEVPELAKAKTWIAGAFAILTALATFTTGHPADVTVLNLIVAGLGAVVTAYVPNLGGELTPAVTGAALAAKAAAGAPVSADELRGWLAELEQLDPAVEAKAAADPGQQPPAAAASSPAPLPIEAAALAAAQTASLPAVPPAG